MVALPDLIIHAFYWKLGGFSNRPMIKELFSNFEEMITPKIISIVFIMLVIFDFFSAIGVIASFFSGYNSGFFIKFVGIVVGIFYFGFSVIVSRVFCELMIVVFKINEHTKRILENQEKNI